MATATKQPSKAASVRETVRGTSRRKGWWGLLVVVLAVGGGWTFIAMGGGADEAPSYQTAGITRGDISLTADATGNLEPQSTIQIGAEISGRVTKVDVDYNDRVTAGQVLARIDTENLSNELAQAEAVLAGNKASLRRANATLSEARTVEKRVKTLRARGAASAADLEAARAGRQRASADVAVNRAQVKSQGVRVEQARTNLGKATITSPINGVVLSRSVEPGNTIAASLQSPELFLLAEDLGRMAETLRHHLGRGRSLNQRAGQ